MWMVATGCLSRERLPIMSQAENHDHDSPTSLLLEVKKAQSILPSTSASISSEHKFQQRSLSRGASFSKAMPISNRNLSRDPNWRKKIVPLCRAGCSAEWQFHAFSLNWGVHRFLKCWIFKAWVISRTLYRSDTSTAVSIQNTQKSCIFALLVQLTSDSWRNNSQKRDRSLSKLRAICEPMDTPNSTDFNGLQGFPWRVVFNFNLVETIRLINLFKLHPL